jgi:hypothetical protein
MRVTDSSKAHCRASRDEIDADSNHQGTSFASGVALAL